MDGLVEKVDQPKPRVEVTYGPVVETWGIWQGGERKEVVVREGLPPIRKQALG